MPIRRNGNVTSQTTGHSTPSDEAQAVRIDRTHDSGIACQLGLATIGGRPVGFPGTRP